MCLKICRCCCCCYGSSSPAASQQQCQELQLKDLTPELMITITTQPHNNSSHNLSSNASLAERPNILGSWSCDEEIEQYNVDDYESRTPTMWRAWWLQGASEQLSSVILS
ncbi:uncharacterized protein LOC115767032 [Drosophila novamexicana]|uniref:uncharacterized protein LOC115767032 n=1 Tax=Drosophila novamexicana TaxID=47314 RepID=UPI0011E5EBDB|nr:uncharacterized protein LOC115767032 [Drosophila novamexicana]